MVISCIYRLRCGLGHSVQEAFDRTKLRVECAGGGGWGPRWGEGRVEEGKGEAELTICNS